MKRMWILPLCFALLTLASGLYDALPYGLSGDDLIVHQVASDDGGNAFIAGEVIGRLECGVLQDLPQEEETTSRAFIAVVEAFTGCRDVRIVRGDAARAFSVDVQEAEAEGVLLVFGAGEAQGKIAGEGFELITPGEGTRSNWNAFIVSIRVDTKASSFEKGSGKLFEMFGDDTEPIQYAFGVAASRKNAGEMAFLLSFSSSNVYLPDINNNPIKIDHKDDDQDDEVLLVKVTSIQGNANFEKIAHFSGIAYRNVFNVQVGYHPIAVDDLDNIYVGLATVVEDDSDVTGNVDVSGGGSFSTKIDKGARGTILMKFAADGTSPWNQPVALLPALDQVGAQAMFTALTAIDGDDGAWLVLSMVPPFRKVELNDTGQANRKLETESMGAFVDATLIVRLNGEGGYVAHQMLPNASVHDVDTAKVGGDSNASKAWLAGSFIGSSVRDSGRELITLPEGDSPNEPTAFLLAVSDDGNGLLFGEKGFSFGATRLDVAKSVSTSPSSVGENVWIGGQVAGGFDERIPTFGERSLHGLVNGFVFVLPCSPGESVFLVERQGGDDGNTDSLTANVLRGTCDTGQQIASVSPNPRAPVCMEKAGTYCLAVDDFSDASGEVNFGPVPLDIQQAGSDGTVLSCIVSEATRERREGEGITQACGFFGGVQCQRPADPDANNFAFRVIVEGVEPESVGSTRLHALESVFALEVSVNKNLVNRSQICAGPTRPANSTLIFVLVYEEDASVRNEVEQAVRGMNETEVSVRLQSFGFPNDDVILQLDGASGGSSALSTASLVAVIVSSVLFGAALIAIGIIWYVRRKQRRMYASTDEESASMLNQAALPTLIKAHASDCARSGEPFDDAGDVYLRGEPAEAVMEMTDSVVVSTSRADGTPSSVKIGMDERLLRNEEIIAEKVASEHLIKPYGPLKVRGYAAEEIEPVVTTAWNELENARTSEDKQRRMLQGLFAGLKHMHERANLVHTNLRVESLYRVGTRWKLTDFGNAVKEDTLVRPQFEGEYTPPEIARAIEDGRKVFPMSQSIDLWSCGVIAHELCSGSLFSPSLVPDTVLRELRQWEVRNATAVPSSKVGLLATQLLQPNPHQRPRIRSAFKMIRGHSESVDKQSTQDWGLEYVIESESKQVIADASRREIFADRVAMSVMLQEVHGLNRYIDAPLQEGPEGTDKDEPEFLVAPGRLYQITLRLLTSTKMLHSFSYFRRVTVQTQDGYSSVLTPEGATRRSNRVTFRIIWNLAEHGGRLAHESKCRANDRLDVRFSLHCLLRDGTRIRLETRTNLLLWKPGQADIRAPFSRDPEVWGEAPSWISDFAIGSTRLFAMGSVLPESAEDDEEEGKQKAAKRSAPRQSRMWFS